MHIAQGPVVRQLGIQGGNALGEVGGVRAGIIRKRVLGDIPGPPAGILQVIDAVAESFKPQDILQVVPCRPTHGIGGSVASHNDGQLLTHTLQSYFSQQPA